MKRNNAVSILTSVETNASVQHLSINPPVVRASTVPFSSVEDWLQKDESMFESFSYGRLGTPTTSAFKDIMTKLEGGYASVLASSGLSIITLVFMAFSKPNTKVLIPNNTYGGVSRFCSKVLSDLNIEISTYDPLNIEQIRNMVNENISLIYVENPGSSNSIISDLPEIVKIATSKHIPIVVDNTWATPLFYQPLAHGADVSIHSATKYLSGHSDCTLGVAVCSQRAYQRVQEMSFYFGLSASPDDTYLAMRGLRTLHVRLKAIEKSALKVASWLNSHRQIESVSYPALLSDVSHKLWKRDFNGATGCFSFKLDTYCKNKNIKFIDNLNMFVLGHSWGGFESSIMPINTEKFPDFSNIRVSIGLENAECLIDDLSNSLKIICE